MISERENLVKVVPPEHVGMDPLLAKSYWFEGQLVEGVRKTLAIQCREWKGYNENFRLKAHLTYHSFSQLMLAINNFQRRIFLQTRLTAPKIIKKYFHSLWIHTSVHRVMVSKYIWREIFVTAIKLLKVYRLVIRSRTHTQAHRCVRTLHTLYNVCGVSINKIKFIICFDMFWVWTMVGCFEIII